MASRFIHLHTHSHYSFLQALPKVDELVEKVKKDGMDAVALTDAGNMHGVIDFYQAATKAEIKPILGVDAYLAPRSRHDKDHDLDAKRSRLVLLAENVTGYRNLLALVTASWTEGFFERPRLDKELLRAHAAGIIAILPSFAGDVAQLLRAGDHNGAAASLAEFTDIFGKENLFLEVSHHPKVTGHEALMQKNIELAHETDTPLVAQHDVYYLDPSDRGATEILRRIQQGERGKNEEEDFSFISEKKALALFKDTPEAVDNTRRIADRCNVELTLGKFVFPNFALPPGKTADELLRELCLAGLKVRGLEGRQDVLERLEYELGIIAFKGYAAYFLVVEDLVRFAREKNIYTNIRGSVAGSMTTYLLQITKIDPLEYKIPFERFLNPERPSAPDIDMDFADNRRDEVIEYAREKYGHDHVAQIGTFGTMMARAAIRDVARALGHSYNTGDRIAKLIPMGSQGFPMTIENAMKLEPDLKSLYNEDDDTKEILDLAQRIEGCVRHVGVHAAGVVVSPTPLVEWTPIQPDPKGTGKLITQYDMYSVGEDGVGLTKFDFLGIKNLTILADAVARVKETRGIDIDIEAIPLDDPKTFAMLARGDTEGTFQLNGTGMTRWLKDLRPTTIHDINAMVALYRPGPMQFIPQYIERKHNPSLITYLDPAMEPILKQTYGILVYQDDLLIMAHEFAGYSWGEVDKFRKAVGKKIPAEMQKQKEKFIDGCVEHSTWPRKKAQEVWAWIEPFAAYGFNKAHSASYGRVAYQTSYLKANYPVEYLAALLTADSGDTEQISVFVGEAKRLGIDVLPPDVNESGTDFTVVGEHRDAIRFGLSSIKNFGEGIAEAIMTERTAHGSYHSLSDFLSRVASKNLNRKSLESLVKAGALDSLAPAHAGRDTLLENIEALLAYHREATASAPQDSLFGDLTKPPELHLPEGTAMSLADKLAWEKELLGIYVSGHPLDAHKDLLAKARLTIAQIKKTPTNGTLVILPVLVSIVRPILTKSGEKMAFVTVEDQTDSIESVVFPKTFKEHVAAIVPGACLLLKAKVSIRNGEATLAIEELKPI
ncbi:DNA polymerase III subunit alpha [Candidatus Kaiserbacteria bacterium CG10_big_fil_rev_8_21_14_0_10_56_12]|uniref:DNA polymerase III subunit alpha n=1 Tax=Candidatus Kaiserbacteria bacterium CG10_big_fil_rev_8_21_14_0_10_56_12 TaxID=1974611 RepID=A0A2H0UAQ4_9BACT|nr:MAG: DNA polymerase III subunit alpha [Candidatus Kaiserbacteria bacterium CG10_big_fil_rev_8_21_14_0_10_56_12]